MIRDNKFRLEKSGLEDDLRKGGEEGQERLENLRELVSLTATYDDIVPPHMEGDGKVKNSNDDGTTISGLIYEATGYMPHGVEKLLEEAALMSDQDSMDVGDQNTVSLMTVHAAKGLEFDVVFPIYHQSER